MRGYELRCEASQGAVVTSCRPARSKAEEGGGGRERERARERERDKDEGDDGGPNGEFGASSHVFTIILPGAFPSAGGARAGWV